VDCSAAVGGALYDCSILVEMLVVVLVIMLRYVSSDLKIVHTGGVVLSQPSWEAREYGGFASMSTCEQVVSQGDTECST
jgi:hypothetical protein